MLGAVDSGLVLVSPLGRATVYQSHRKEELGALSSNEDVG